MSNNNTEKRDRRQLTREWVTAHQDSLTLPATLLLYYSQTLANEKGELWPSRAAMQAQTGLSQGSITNGLRVLQATGIITRAGWVRQVVRWRFDFDKMLRDAVHDQAHTGPAPCSQVDGGDTTGAQSDDHTGPTAGSHYTTTWHGLCHHMAGTMPSHGYGSTNEVPTKVPRYITTAETKSQPEENGQDQPGKSEKVKKENRTKDKGLSEPFNEGTYVTNQARLKKENKIGLANYWRDLVHERNGYNGIPIDLTVKDREMLFSVALKLEFDWDIVRPLMRHTIEKWSYFRMDVSTQAGGKIGTSPKVGAFVQHLDIALSEWQSVASQPTVEVLKSNHEPVKIVKAPKPTSATGMSKEAEDEVLNILKDMQK